MIDAATVRAALNYERFYTAEVGELRGTGSERKQLCPFHPDRNPSLNINIETGLFNCYPCSKGGDVFGFVAEKHGLSFRASVEYVATRYAPHLDAGKGVSRPVPIPTRPSEQVAEKPPIPEEVAREYHARLLGRDDLIEFLLVKRGLTMETIKDRQLGHDGERYTIPVRDAGGAIPPPGTDGARSGRAPSRGRRGVARC